VEQDVQINDKIESIQKICLNETVMKIRFIWITAN